MLKFRYVYALLVLFVALASTRIAPIQIPESISPQVASVSETQTTSVDTYSVVRVVDGDTIVVSKNGLETKVRMIGINTPESVDPRKTVQCFGLEASHKTKELLEGQTVRLTLDPTQSATDKYGRTLAYVYRSDGLLINQELIQQGYAYEYTYKLPYQFQKEFKTLEKTARENGYGLWAASTCAGKK